MPRENAGFIGFPCQINVQLATYPMDPEVSPVSVPTTLRLPLLTLLGRGREEDGH